MQISKERQEARIRVTKIEIAIHQGLETLPPNQEYTELILALLNVAQSFQNNVLRMENPNPEE